MSRSHNHVCLLGNTGNAPETIEGGISFSLATSEEWTDDNNEKRSRTDWHRCVMFGKRASRLAQYIRKGARLMVTGKLRSSSYTDDKGVTRRSVDVAVSEVHFCDGPKPRATSSDHGGDSDMPGEE
ncbi:MAG: single-stranded DNA-binding protein [Polyangiales bacterium]